MRAEKVIQSAWLGLFPAATLPFFPTEAPATRDSFSASPAIGFSISTRETAIRQAVVRVTWNEAQASCRWLADRTSQPFALPTEAQWEYACRAGSTLPMSWGEFTADFAERANMADRKIRNFTKWDFSPLNQIYDGWMPLVDSVDDGAMVTAEVGRYAPNPWGLYDMHGNAAEWTLSLYRPYPYDPGDGRDTASNASRRAAAVGAQATRRAAGPAAVQKNSARSAGRGNCDR